MGYFYSFFFIIYYKKAQVERKMFYMHCNRFNYNIDINKEYEMCAKCDYSNCQKKASHGLSINIKDEIDEDSVIEEAEISME